MAGRGGCGCNSGRQTRSQPDVQRPQTSPEVSERRSSPSGGRRPCTCGGTPEVCRCATTTLPPCTCGAGGPCTCEQRRREILESCICRPRGRSAERKRRTSSAKSGKKGGKQKTKGDDKSKATGEKGEGEDKSEADAGKNKKAAKKAAAEAAAEAKKAKAQEKMINLIEELLQLRANLKQVQAQAAEEEQKLTTAQDQADTLQSQLDTCKAAEAKRIAKFKKEKSELVSRLQKEQAEIVQKLENEKKELLKNQEKEKAELKKKMEQEEQKQRAAHDQAMQEIGEEQKNTSDRIEKAEVAQMTSTNKMRQEGNALVSTFEQRDNQLRRLSMTTENLADTIRKLDEDNQKLTDIYNNLLQNYNDIQMANQYLSKENEGLVTDVKNAQGTHQELKARSQALQSQINEYKAEAVAFAEEMERLKSKLKAIMAGAATKINQARLQEKLRESRDRERRWMDEASYIAAKMRELEEKSQGTPSSTAADLDQANKEYKALQTKYESIQSRIIFIQEEHKAKMEVMQEEFEDLQKEMKKREERLNKHIAALQSDMARLKEAAGQDNDIVKTLSTRIRRQENGIKIQNDTIIIRCQQFENETNNIATLKDIQVALKDLIKTTTVSLDDVKQRVEALQKEEAELSDQLKKVNKALSEKTKALNEERGRTARLRGQLVDLDNRLQSFEEELMVLEGQGLGAADEGKSMATTTSNMTKGDEVRAPTKQEKIAEMMEAKLLLLQEECEVEVNIIEKQKRNALGTLRFASDCMGEMVGDFGEQIKINRALQLLLMRLLYEKEEQAKYAVDTPPGASKRPVSAGKVRRRCSNPRCIDPSCKV